MQMKQIITRDDRPIVSMIEREKEDRGKEVRKRKEETYGGRLSERITYIDNELLTHNIA